MRYRLLPFLIVFFSFQVLSQTVKGVQIVKAELISDASDFSKPFTVGIRFEIEPEWYLYWKNPGDSGLPIEVQWVLPRGWTADELRHPVPQKMAHGNVVSYGYKKEVVLLTTITPKGSSRGRMKAKLDWLVCEKSCVRGKAEVSLDMKNQSAGKRADAKQILDRWKGLLPLARSENPVTFQKAFASMQGAAMNIEIPFQAKQGVQIVDFFPASIKGFLIDYRTVGVKNNKIMFSGTDEGTGTGEIYLSGLLIGSDGKGYECSVPVKFSSL
jgi:thiol:disulfide interchange protein DsbD